MNLRLTHFQRHRQFGIGRRGSTFPALKELDRNNDILGLEHSLKTHYYIRDSRMSNEIPISEPRKVEPWRRLWLPATAWDQFRDIDKGFLADHGNRDGVEFSFSDPPPGIGFLADHAAVPFLLLLGRPGSGKSHELASAAALGTLGQPSVLVEAKELGVANPGSYFQTVLASELEAPVRLIIDGLDEILLVNPTFVSQLKAWFRRNLNEQGQPKHTLAVSCRWADWPQSQIEDLAALWPAEGFKPLVLGPLLRSDATATMQRRLGEHAEAFWRQINNLHLLHVACWPQGVLALMQQFEDSGFKSIATSHADAIRDQVIRHCRLADSPDDIVRWQQSVEGAEWRRRIAGRVAAAMVVSGRAQLDLADTAATSDQDAVTPAELATTEELWEGRWIIPKLADLDAVVHLTGLMKRLSRGNRWVFQSQVHQEWLAADWLAVHNLGVPRLQQIFGVEAGERWVIAPAMRATAAWLARIDGKFRNLLLRHDPLALLRMDGACLPESERAEVVEALLVATDGVRVVDPALRHAHLPSLKHGALIEQLSRWLTNHDASDAARELAIEIAEKTALTEIAGLLWQVYPRTTGRLQVEVAGGLSRLARDGFDAEWRAVLHGDTPIDEHGTLLGAALEIMVLDSDKVPLRDVLELVFPGRHFEVYGHYDTIIRQLHDRLTMEDLPAVFTKLAEHPHSIHDSLFRAKDFNDRAVAMAIREFDQPEAASALVEYWHACLLHHVVPQRNPAELWPQDPGDSKGDDLRRKVVLALVNHPAFDRHRGQGWVMTEDFLLEDHDFKWCVERILEAAPDDEWRFSLVVASMCWRVDLSGAAGEALAIAWLKSPFLRDQLPAPADGELIGSAITRIAAEQQAKREQKNQQFEKRHRQREQASQNTHASTTQQCREAHEQGRLVWPGVVSILVFRRSGGSSGMVSFKSIAEIGPRDGWMIQAAARFLTDVPLRVEIDHSYGLYGLLALASCAGELEHDGPVRRSIEQHWLTHLIPLLSNHGLGDPPSGISNERLALLFPAAFTAGCGAFCRERYRGNGSLSELSALVKCQLPGITDHLKAILIEEAVQPEGFFNGLRWLAHTDEEAAIEVALRWLRELQPDTPRAIRAAVIGAAATLVSGRLATEVAAELADVSLVRDTIRAAASRLEWHKPGLDFSTWSDFAIKSLGEACWRAFTKPDRHRGRRGTFEFNEVSDDDHAMEFRDRISAAAWSRGIELAIPETCDGESEDDTRQRQHLIDWHRHAATQIRAGAGWTPLPPSEFLKLANRPQARLARNQDELLEAVIECLRRWETSLETVGSWDHLWDLKTRSSRPEKRIAREMRDWLKAHLDVLVEREIELASEDRADVVVQTQPTDGASPTLTVVIELKKFRQNNAKERRTAMKSQLMDRYLRERSPEGWTHGLYVIAWTPEPGSTADSSDAIEQADRHLVQQAEQLCIPPFVLGSMVIDARFRKNMGRQSI